MINVRLNAIFCVNFVQNVKKSLIFLAYFEKKQYFCGRNVTLFPKSGAKLLQKNETHKYFGEKSSIILGFALRIAAECYDAGEGG